MANSLPDHDQHVDLAPASGLSTIPAIGGHRSIGSSTPWAPIHSLIESREIVYYLTRQRLVRRFRGSFLGLVWLFVSPAIMLALYTLVFGVMLKSRWNPENSGTSEFALMLFLGLCVFWFFSEVLSEAPNLISNHSTYVKKVVFPTEVLPWVLVGQSLFLTLLRFAVFVMAFLYLRGAPPATILLLPLVWVPLTLVTVGLAWMLAAIGAFVKDLSEFVSLILLASLFLSPVFYPLELLPESIRSIVFLNPVTLPILQTRDLAVYGQLPALDAWLCSLAVSVLVSWMGFWVFQRSRGVFGDVT